MSFFTRLQRITQGHIEKFLSSVEDPEIIYPQLLREMEDRVRSATSAEALAMAAAKTAERELAELKAKIERMTKGAKLALDKGDEQTARDALSAQIELEAKVPTREDVLAKSLTAQEQAKEARKSITSQLDELRMKKDEILARARAAKNQKSVMKTVSGKSLSASSLADEASRMEASVEQMEAELTVQKEVAGNEPRGAALDRKIKDMERSSNVEDRLAALKQKTGAK